MKIKINQNGFTLVELTVVIIIISILSITLSIFITNWLQAAVLSQKRADLLNNAQNAVSTISTDVQLSGSVDVNNRWEDPNGPGGNYAWASGTQVLVLAKAAIDNSNNIIFSDPAKYISQKDNVIYYLSNKTLYRRTLQSDSDNDAATTTCPPSQTTSTCPADRSIATDVSSLSFNYIDIAGDTTTPDNARAVQVSITLSEIQDNNTINASYSTRMVFRNE
ncbi:MAG TPA: prepilin-type N-terminal cleavage/methylation domain-containing protein [Patescibacteria group bacterium]|nr:prepilin-type N-terminal cleavage/methylation domain-containing protein [Patescibacteria group bacterium]